MSKTLRQHLVDYIQSYLGRDIGAWIVWCDPQGEWEPLLKRVLPPIGEIALVSITDQIVGAFGGPLARRTLQDRIEAKTSFIVYVQGTPDQLGWLWAQALLAEHTHVASLRHMLSTWGWRPQNISTSDADVARLSRQHLDEDPTEWGGGQIIPEPAELLALLAGAPLYMPSTDGELDENTRKDQRLILDLTVETAGLPEINEQHLERWRLESLACLLVTQAHKISPAQVGRHEFLIAEERRVFALKLLDDWQDSLRLRRSLPKSILEADQMLALGSYFTDADFPVGTFLSYAIERALFANICTRLAQKRGRDLLDDLAPLADFFSQHVRGFWGDSQTEPLPVQAIPWSELERLSKAVMSLLDAAPIRSWSNPAEALHWYTETGWQVEQAGEALMRQLNRPTSELLNLITPLREAYTNHWENYMLQWSDLWSQAGYPVPAYSTQGEWLKEQLKDSRGTAVLVIDALRYDIGVVLKNLVNARQGAERASVFPARTALPTITAVGMAMALPIAEKDLQATLLNGKWQVYQQGSDLNLSLAENRREWLRTNLNMPAEALLPLDKKGGMLIPAPKGRQARLFLFDSTIDKLGHDDELEPMGSQSIQERYIAIIDQLYAQGWARILFVTDHGFIHWPGLVGEHRLAAPLPEPAYSSRRALAYPAQVPLNGPQGLAPGGQWRLAFTAGTSCFKTYGGLGYFHGGASLQEWIVPCLKIEWPVKAKPVQLSIQPIAQILSLRQKIILEVQHETLFTNENFLKREVEIIVRDSLQKHILFRSQRTVITPNQEQVSLYIEAVEGAEATRGTTVKIELLDTHTGSILATQPSVLLVELENW